MLLSSLLYLSSLPSERAHDVSAKSPLTPIASCCVTLTRFPEEPGHSPQCLCPSMAKTQAVKTQAHNEAWHSSQVHCLASWSELTVLGTPRPIRALVTKAACSTQLVPASTHRYCPLKTALRGLGSSECFPPWHSGHSLFCL